MKRPAAKRLATVLFTCVFFLSACGGATAHQQLYAASEAQCGGGAFGVVSLGDDEVLFVGGHGMSHRAFVRSGDPGFDDLVLHGGDLASDRILCGRNSPTSSIECSGYFTERDGDLFDELFPLDAESPETLRKDFEEWLASPEAGTPASTYMRGPQGGRTLQVRSMQFTAELRDIGTGQTLDRTEALIGGECSEMLSDYDLVDSEPTGRMQVPPEIVEQIVLELTGEQLR